jgi:hypothetical protein
MPNTNINVDLIGRGGGQGEVANYMAQAGKMSPSALRPFIGNDGRTYISVFQGGDTGKPENYRVIPIQANATLRRDEWKRLDDAVLGIAEFRLGGVDDLVSRGLTYDLGNGMATTVLEWHDVGDALTADLTMDGLARAQGDRPEWQHNYLPIPIIHADYEINTRALMASRNMGNAIDTTMAERAARKVREKLESMLFTNTTYAFGAKDERNRNSIYSYVNFPDRIQETGQAWDDTASSGGPTGKSIVLQVIAWKQSMINAYQYGPWKLYIPTAYETILDQDYVDTNPDTRTSGTIRERLLAISGVEGIQVVDTLPANNVIMVQLTSDVVRLVRGMALQNVQWQEEGQFVTKYKVMTIQVPQIRSDQNGRTGLLHAVLS